MVPPKPDTAPAAPLANLCPLLGDTDINPAAGPRTVLAIPLTAGAALMTANRPTNPVAHCVTVSLLFTT